MDAEITPEPSPEEREALLAALASSDGERPEPSAWWLAGVRDEDDA